MGWALNRSYGYLGYGWLSTSKAHFALARITASGVCLGKAKSEAEATCKAEKLLVRVTFV